ncbi:MAG: hypothetical protein NT169_22055 [Chloroflexi bacterium]|nr:hypothetical protein [Chloroflexota bacterium]
MAVDRVAHVEHQHIAGIGHLEAAQAETGERGVQRQVEAVAPEFQATTGE